jgi:hypothetical protein
VAQRFSTLAAGLAVGTCLAWAAAAPRPADAGRPSTPDVRGSYFGSFTTRRAGTWAGEINVVLQDRSLIGAELRIGGRYSGVPLRGTVASNRRVRMSGASGVGRNQVRFRITGMCRAGANGEQAAFEGEYRMTGAETESGSFTMIGNAR